MRVWYRESATSRCLGAAAQCGHPGLGAWIDALGSNPSPTPSSRRCSPGPEPSQPSVSPSATWGDDHHRAARRAKQCAHSAHCTRAVIPQKRPSCSESPNPSLTRSPLDGGGATNSVPRSVPAGGERRPRRLTPSGSAPVGEPPAAGQLCPARSCPRQVQASVSSLLKPWAAGLLAALTLGAQGREGMP